MWFTETAWPPIVMLSIVAVACGLAAMLSQRGKWLVAAGLVVVLAGVVWYVEKLIVTPAEQVEANLLAMIDAFQKNNEAETISYISPQSKGLVALAKLGIQVVDVEPGYRVTDIRVTTIANDTAATSHFRVNATIRMPSQGNLGHQPLRFNGKWRVEAGQWRLTEIEELDPIHGEPLNRFHLLK